MFDTPKEVIIDGQQRLTSLYAVMKGKKVINSKFDEKSIVISYCPLQNKFEVGYQATKNDPEWIYNISDLFIKLATKKTSKKLIFTLIALFLLGGYYFSRIVLADVSSYDGRFVEYYRTSVVAPPLPFTSKYVFLNDKGEKQICYLDSFSKKKIIPFQLEEGKKYTIFYETGTNIIVQVIPLE